MYCSSLKHDEDHLVRNRIHPSLQLMHLLQYIYCHQGLPPTRNTSTRATTSTLSLEQGRSRKRLPKKNQPSQTSSLILWVCQTKISGAWETKLPSWMAAFEIKYGRHVNGRICRLWSSLISFSLWVSDVWRRPASFH
jgi:hypothetical protein